MHFEILDWLKEAQYDQLELRAISEKNILGLGSNFKIGDIGIILLKNSAFLKT